LQDKKSDKEFGKACRAEVERFEQETAKDYRLNYRLYNACKGDIGATCKNACELKEGEICGGKVCGMTGGCCCVLQVACLLLAVGPHACE
jgi:Golgi apparatus protein 1